MGSESNIFYSQLHEFQYGDEVTGEDAWYFKLSKEVGANAREKKSQLESPDLSKIDSLSDLFGLVRDASNPLWEQAMKACLDQSFVGYEPKSQKGRDFLQSIGQKDALLQDMRGGNNQQLEALRGSGDTEIWVSLILAMSEREQLKATVLYDWIGQMTEDQEKICSNKWGMSKKELLIFSGLNMELQPSIDRAYIQQLIITDSDKSSHLNPAEYSASLSAPYLYISDEAGGQKWFPFKEVFPREITSIETILSKYSSQIKQGLKDKSLNQTYKNLPKLLIKLANLFSLKNTSFESVDQVVEECADLSVQLIKDGCPIIVNPPGFVSKELARVDIEFMISIVVGEKSEWYQDSKELYNISEKMLKEKNLSIESLVPIVHQLSGPPNGSNIAYHCLASSGAGYINFDDIRHKEVGKDVYGRFHNLIKSNTTVDRFTKALAIGTITHEDGHLFAFLDEAMYQKLGSDVYLNKLEELKADCVSMLLFKKYQESGKTDLTSEEYLEQQLLNYSYDIISSEVNPPLDLPSFWYAFSGKTIIGKLFESGAIDWVDNQFVILDATKGVSTIARLGEQIIERYSDENFGSIQVNQFVKETEASYEHDPRMNSYLEQLKFQQAKTES